MRRESRGRSSIWRVWPERQYRQGKICLIFKKKKKTESIPSRCHNCRVGSSMNGAKKLIIHMKKNKLTLPYNIYKSTQNGPKIQIRKTIRGEHRENLR